MSNKISLFVLCLFSVLIFQLICCCHAAPDYALASERLRRSTRFSGVDRKFHEARWLIEKYESGKDGEELEPNSRSALIEALKNFVELQKIPWDTPSCTKEEYDILMFFTLETRAHMYHAHPQRVLNYLEWLVYQISQNHAEKCLPIYPCRFELQSASLNPRAKQVVEEFMQPMMDFRPGSEHEYMLNLLKRKSFDVFSDSVRAAEYIRAESLTDPYRGVTEYIMEHYLFGPCEQYYNHFKSEPFDLALLDAQMYQPGSEYDLQDLSLMPYIQGLFRYKFCKAIQENEEFHDRVYDLLRGHAPRDHTFK